MSVTTETYKPPVKRHSFYYEMSKLLWHNPVVMRDLRIRMRESRSYLSVAFFLFFTILLVTIGYISASNQIQANGQINIVNAQSQLQSLYYFVFEALAALIVLIAPALTASCIIIERQRMSLDLIFATPMTSMQLLFGKLVSSTAFLALLLILSLPASALCVILGGATFGDVLQSYLLLFIDGLVLTSIGLLCSCTARKNLIALVATYISIGIYLIFTLPLVAIISPMATRGSTMGPVLAFSSLNPFLAITMLGTGYSHFSLMGHNIPVWIGAAIIACVLVNMLLALAGYRLGVFGVKYLSIFRLQSLLISAFITVAFVSSVAPLATANPGTIDVITITLLISLFVVGIFLPTLFIPAYHETEGRAVTIDKSYQISKAFQPGHSGSLPYFHLWIITIFISSIAAEYFTVHKPLDIKTAAFTLFYISGVGYLVWSIARRATSLLLNRLAASTLTFLSIVAVILAPVMLDSDLLYNRLSSDYSVSAIFWLFYPLMHLNTPKDACSAFTLTGTMCYLLGLLIFPYWIKLTPGGLHRVNRQRG